MLGMFRHRDPATGYIKRRSPTCGASPDDPGPGSDLDLDSNKPRDLSASTSSSSSSSPSSAPEAAMVAVDVFFLTFNCAKNLVDVPVLATHLLPALTERSAGAGLPDVVAL